MLPQLEQGLIGAAAGEHRDIVVHFPADYRATELAGKQADFKVEVKTVEEAALPELDEEFCKSFGVTEGGVPKLREDVANNMRRELEQTCATATRPRSWTSSTRRIRSTCRMRWSRRRSATCRSRPCAAPAPRTCRRRRRASRWWSRRGAAWRSG
jgi:hypothetical protein